jgi:glycosidase
VARTGEPMTHGDRGGTATASTTTQPPGWAPEAIRQQRGGIEVRLNPYTALPAGLANRPGGPTVPFPLAIEVEDGGVEVPGTTGGVAYQHTRRERATSYVPGSLGHVTAGPDETYTVETLSENWRIRSSITFRATHPRVALRVAVTAQAGPHASLLRDLHLSVDWPLDHLGDWCVEAPGNTLRPGVPLATVAEPVGVLTVGDGLGSPGVVVLHHPEAPRAIVVWPFSRSEPAQATLRPEPASLRLHLQTQLAGAVEPGDWLEYGPVYLDVVDATWDELRPGLRHWYPSMGLTTPRERPGWAAALNLYEVMVGFAPFHGGKRYSPYPTFADLLADLDRIAGLGAQCLQLMPRHPYPSYNIHQPGDVGVSYCEPDELRGLVAACHERGMRIILDVLMHGVLDKQVMERTIALVQNGPHAARLEDRCSDVYTPESEEISWCRHILDFAPFWLDGAPEVHPLLTAHPDWFMRDSNGNVTGRYTNALDPANCAWQDHFIDTCEQLVLDYGIDGFRLDAPVYNKFANWSPTARRHASFASLGSYLLLRKLRDRLRRLSPDILLYTEPGSPLARESLDLNYGYEERWLISSLYDAELADANDWRRVRTGRELATWFRDFDALLPAGSVIAHFVDAHDTVWWRLPGDQWRRDQFGLPVTKALLATYALRSGAYMTFVGGEVGVEDELRAVHSLRTRLPEIRAGASDYDAVTFDHDAIYALLRHTPDRATIVAVNTSGRALHSSGLVRMPSGRRTNSGRVFDAYSNEWLSLSYDDGPEGQVRLDLSFDPYQARVLVLDGLPDELG